MRPLAPEERQLAEVSARLIARAEEAGLPDPPRQLGVTDRALRLLARAHLELRDQVHGLHDRVDLTDPSDPVGVALTAVGLTERPHTENGLREALWQQVDDLTFSTRTLNALRNAGVRYLGELVQQTRPRLLRLKNFGKASLKEVEEKLAIRGLFLGHPLEGWPGSPGSPARPTTVSTLPMVTLKMPSLTLVRESFGVPMSVPPGAVLVNDEETARALDASAVDSPAISADINAEELLALYCRVMQEVAEVFVKHETYVVRVWDGMDGCWTDCTGEVSREDALRTWAKRTDGGARCVSYAEIDYYRIFPGGTRMHWDGSEDREMHR